MEFEWMWFWMNYRCVMKSFSNSDKYSVYFIILFWRKSQEIWEVVKLYVSRVVINFVFHFQFYRILRIIFKSVFEDFTFFWRSNSSNDSWKDDVISVALEFHVFWVSHLVVYENVHFSFLFVWCLTAANFLAMQSLKCEVWNVCLG